MVKAANVGNAKTATGYFPGPGTEGGIDLSAAIPTERVIEIGERAYADFSRRATAWLEQNPGGDVTAAFAAFSRGNAVAAVFSQMLYERGVIHPATGQVLVAPGQVGISAGLALDPVGTGVGANLSFAPNARNIVVVQAVNEYREFFKLIDYSGHPGVSVLSVLGNHGDIGGGYDNGIGALVLASSAEMLRNAGIAVAPIPADRHFSPEQAVIHDEAFDTEMDYATGEYKTVRRWGSYGTVAEGTERRIDPSRTLLPPITETRADGSEVSTFTNYRGELVVLTSSTDDQGTTVHSEVKYPGTDQNRRESYLFTSADGRQTVLSTPDGAGGWLQTTALRTVHDDGSLVVDLRRPDGTQISAVYDADRRLYSTTTDSTDAWGERLVELRYSDGRRELSRFGVDGLLSSREVETPAGRSVVLYDSQGGPMRTTLSQRDEEGQVLEFAAEADGSGVLRLIDRQDGLVIERPFKRPAGADDGESVVELALGGRTVAVRFVLDEEAAVAGGRSGLARMTGLDAIDGEEVTDALTAQDLAAFGLTFEDLLAGEVPASAALLIEGLDPGLGSSHGWGVPAIVDVAVPQGFERRIELGNGWSAISSYDSDRRLFQVNEIYSASAFAQEQRTWQVNADGSRSLVMQSSRTTAADGSYLGMETDLVTLEVYQLTGDGDGNSTRTLAVDATAQWRSSQAAAATATIFSDINSLVSALGGGQPIPVLASGLRLLNTFNQENGQPLESLGAASTVAAGVLSVYNLYNAFQGGDDLSRVNATLTSLAYSNEVLLANTTAGSAGLSHLLNGTGIANGAPGALPVIGLVASIRAEDPIGIAMSMGTLLQGAAFLTSNPVGWVLIAASILRTMFAEGPPDAWGVAKVGFADGAGNLGSQVHASGENFGPDRVRQQLQGIVDTLSQLVAQHNASNPDSAQWLGLVPQRMPGLTWRAREFEDEGYAVTDVDPLTGAQRIPFVRFDDNGEPFNFIPDQLTVAERDMLSLPGTQAPPLVAYMLNSALQRGAIAPLWEVRTARLQQNAGDPDAGLREEERAAKNGLAAPMDTAYANAHPNDPQAAQRRVGRFMPVALDLSGDGRIDARTIAQLEAQGIAITFDWDGQGYQKRTGWIGPQDGLLVLDHDFNQSADSARELMSNPLIADAGKGLRVLAAYDANRDGRIDASDPVYERLQVWQDLDQDGNNTQVLDINGVVRLAQDETNGQREMRSLAEAGIRAIHYASGRYETTHGQQRLAATQVLEAQVEGVRYTPVGAGIAVHPSDGQPVIVVTQVQSEAAVFDGLQVATAGETLGTPASPLYEDGVPWAYNPAVDGGEIELVISAGQLLANDTWAGLQGAEAGIVISGARAGAHTRVALRPDGNLSLWLQANYHGAAEFFYTVAVPGYENRITPKEARVGLNVTPVNDRPVVSVETDPPRSVFGYAPQPYAYQVTTGTGEDSYVDNYAGTLAGTPIYTPYVERVPPQPIYEDRWVSHGEDGHWQQVQVGTRPAYDVPHHHPISSDQPNTGRILASDPDGGRFRFEVLSQPLYGAAEVDADGRWRYLGRRPQAYQVPDITGDGQADWVNPDGSLMTWYTGDPNIASNGYIGAETESFADYFTVRVHDESDPSAPSFRDVQVRATHYGPAPLPVVADSGGEGWFDPIAIDLDGDGFHFRDVDDSNVFFEVNGEGWRRRIAWPEAGDGLLVVDRDGNGLIDRSDEISFIPDAPGESTDLAALAAAYDTNGDGRLDARDAPWSRLGVWQDANGNGLTDPGELHSLAQRGITAIELATDGQFRVIDGQTVHGIARAERADGSTLAVADVTLRYTNEVRPAGEDGPRTVTAPASSAGQDFEGTDAADLVFGTDGSDRHRPGAGDDVVLDDAGDDVVDAGAGDDLVYTGRGNDVVYGGAGNDRIYTGAGNDLVFGDGEEGGGDDFIMLEDGNDIAFAGAGNDLVAGGAGNDVISGNAGHDRLFGEDGWDVLFGQEGDDELYGQDGNDQLDGGAGNDLLSGGRGDDRMDGGPGDDHYEVDAPGDEVIEAEGGGHDSVTAGIDYTLGANVEDLRLAGAALQGTGNAADNLLVGNAQDNLLRGLGGGDTLDGGAGADTLEGGEGDDTYYVDDAGDRVVEAPGEGVDTVRSRITHTLAANVERLELLGGLAIDGTGNAQDNELVGNAAANRLDGGAGADRMAGGMGDDVYAVDDSGDAVIERALEGLDTVEATIDYVLPQHVEQLRLLGPALRGTGNALDNLIVGNALGNHLDGGSGADVLVGGDGDDAYVIDDAGDRVVERAGEGHDTVRSSVSFTLPGAVEDLLLQGAQDVAATGNALDNLLVGNAGANRLDGGTGADRMVGGAGDDTYVVDQAGDTIIEWAGHGLDTVIAGIDYVLPQHVERLTLAGRALRATGNVDANLIQGNALDNWLDGAAGADTLAGSAGNDTYEVDDAGDRVIERAGEGEDTVRSRVSFTLPEAVEHLVLLCTQDIAGTGNALANRITGNSGNNRLDGGAGDDTYVYDLGGGLDTIVDVQGEDTLAFGPGLTPERVMLRIVLSGGGAQARLRVLDDAGRELPGQGVDFALQRDARGRLRSPIEHFVFADGRRAEWGDLLGAPLALVGTRAADLLIGGRGAETLRGDAGDDVLYAGAGNDTLYGDAGNDFLYGHGGKDRLWGGNGDDVLDGGAGDDLLVGENGSDWLVDREGDNVLNGGNHDDVLLAGAGADWLQGGNGDDWLAGGRGSDRLETGTGRNLVAFNRGDGWDRLESGGRDVLSLGGGLRLSDLRLSRSGADLRIDLGQGDGLTLEEWYASGPGKRVDTLQLVTLDDAGARSERFDFARIVQAFDRARSPQAAGSGGWSAMEAALAAHLGTSRSAALGGELSIQYAATGSLAGLDPMDMHGLLGAGASQLKALPPGHALASGASRLLA